MHIVVAEPIMGLLEAGGHLEWPPARRRPNGAADYGAVTAVLWVRRIGGGGFAEGDYGA